MVIISNLTKKYLHPGLIRHLEKTVKPNNIFNICDPNNPFGNGGEFKFGKHEFHVYEKHGLINVVNDNSAEYPNLALLKSTLVDSYDCKRFDIKLMLRFVEYNNNFDSLSISIKSGESVIEERFRICRNDIYYDHRLDGPSYSYICRDGNFYKQWNINGVCVGRYNNRVLGPTVAKEVEVTNDFPLFENGKQVNDIVIDNAMKIKLMMFDREYFDYVMAITNKG